MRSDKGFVLLSSVFKNLQIPLPWQIFSGEERSLMALAPLLRMNWPLGLHCFDPDEYMTKIHFGNVNNNK